MKMKAFQRIGSAIMALAMIASMQLTANAAVSKIDGISGERSLEELFQIGQSGDPYSLEVRPGDEIRIPLTSDMFTWTDGRSPLPMAAAKLAELKNGQVRVKTKIQAGHEVLDYVQLDWDTFDGTPFKMPYENRPTNKTAYISVMFAENLKSTENVDFKLDIILSVDGKSDEDFQIRLLGAMVVDVEDIDSGTDSIDMSEGLVVKATEYVPRAAANLGNGLTIYKNFHEGNKYYAICAIVDDMDLVKEQFPEVYPSVVMVYRLETINMRKGLSEVEIKPPLEDAAAFYHVYGDDMEYLGTTKELLPYADTYVLTTRELSTFELGNYEESLSNAPIQEREQEDAEVWFDTEPNAEAEAENAVTGNEPRLNLTPNAQEDESAVDNNTPRLDFSAAVGAAE